MRGWKRTSDGQEKGGGRNAAQRDVKRDSKGKVKDIKRKEGRKGPIGLSRYS